MEQPSGAGTASRSKAAVWLVIVVVVVAALYVLVLRAYHQEGENRTAWLTAGATETAKDRLEIIAAVQSIDPVKGEMVVRLDLAAEGSVVGEDGRLKQDLAITTNSSLKPEINFKKGQPLSAVDVTVELFDGLYTDYPFDHHEGELAVYATSKSAAKEGEVAEETDVPVRMELYGFVHGYSLVGEAAKESTPDYPDINVHIARSSSTVIWAVFVMALLWLMALAVAGVTYYIVTAKRKLEWNQLGWMGAMLFAFVSFRGAAPNVPPLGSLIDFAAFFWAEFIVAVCLVITVIVYLVRHPK
jgi:hypothetical protein